MGNKNYHN